MWLPKSLDQDRWEKLAEFLCEWIFDFSPFMIYFSCFSRGRRYIRQLLWYKLDAYYFHWFSDSIRKSYITVLYFLGQRRKNLVWERRKTALDKSGEVRMVCILYQTVKNNQGFLWIISVLTGLRASVFSFCYHMFFQKERGGDRGIDWLL